MLARFKTSRSSKTVEAETPPSPRSGESRQRGRSSLSAQQQQSGSSSRFNAAKNRRRLEAEKAALKARERSNLDKQRSALRRQQEFREKTAIWNDQILLSWDDLKGSCKVKELCRRGIPPNIRGKVWPLLIGNKLQINAEMFEYLNLKVLDVYGTKFASIRLSGSGDDSDGPAAATMNDRRSGQNIAAILGAARGSGNCRDSEETLRTQPGQQLADEISSPSQSTVLPHISSLHSTEYPVCRDSFLHSAEEAMQTFEELQRHRQQIQQQLQIEQGVPVEANTGTDMMTAEKAVDSDESDNEDILVVRDGSVVGNSNRSPLRLSPKGSPASIHKKRLPSGSRHSGERRSSCSKTRSSSNKRAQSAKAPHKSPQVDELHNSRHMSLPTMLRPLLPKSPFSPAPDGEMTVESAEVMDVTEEVWFENERNGSLNQGDFDAIHRQLFFDERDLLLIAGDADAVKSAASASLNAVVEQHNSRSEANGMMQKKSNPSDPDTNDNFIPPPPQSSPQRSSSVEVRLECSSIRIADENYFDYRPDNAATVTDEGRGSGSSRGRSSGQCHAMVNAETDSAGHQLDDSDGYQSSAYSISQSLQQQLLKKEVYHSDDETQRIDNHHSNERTGEGIIFRGPDFTLDANSEPNVAVASTASAVDESPLMSKLLHRDSVTKDSQSTQRPSSQSLSLHQRIESHSVNSAADRNARLVDIMSLIEWDLPRTYPTLGFFHDGGPMHLGLERVLMCYVCYRPDIGYVQGMSFLVATLLLYMDEYEAFKCLANMLESRLLTDFYCLRKESIDSCVMCFDHYFRKLLPLLHQHLNEEGVTSEMFLMDWYLSLFTKALPLELATHIWDIFLSEGESFLLCVGLGILKLYAPRLSSYNFERISPFLLHLPENIKADALLHSISQIRISKRSYEKTRIKMMEKCYAHAAEVAAAASAIRTADRQSPINRNSESIRSRRLTYSARSSTTQQSTPQRRDTYSGDSVRLHASQQHDLPHQRYSIRNALRSSFRVTKDTFRSARDIFGSSN